MGFNIAILTTEKHLSETSKFCDQLRKHYLSILTKNISFELWNIDQQSEACVEQFESKLADELEGKDVSIIVHF